MGVKHVLKPLQQLYHETTNDKIIVNDIPYMDNFGDENILNQIMTIYESEIMSTVPKCSCIDGKGLSGRYNIGVVCSRCNSRVADPQEDITPTMWLRSLYAEDANVTITNTPTYIPFMAPGFWSILSRLLYNNSKKRIKVDYLLWLCDDQLKLPPEVTNNKHHLIMEDLLKTVLNNERSYVNVINNLENILLYLRNNQKFMKKLKTDDGDVVYNSIEIDIILDLYYKSKEQNGCKSIFTDYLPIINKHIFIMEKGPRGKFTQMKSAININVIKNWISLCSSIKERSILGYQPYNALKIGRETARVCSDLSKLYTDYIKEYCYKKTGLLRKLLGGAKSAFTFRGVIISREGPHDRNGVEIPWSIAVPLFTPHISNKLLKRGYSMRKINNIISKSTLTYNKLIHDILLELKNEAPNGRPPMIIHRNPTLLRSSANLVFIDKIGTDPFDKTIGFSQLIAKYSNADYDGIKMQKYKITTCYNKACSYFF